MQRKKIRRFTLPLVETAMLIALGFGLSYIRYKIVPNGGAITAASMLPVLLIGIRHGLGWGIGGSTVYALLQAMQGGALRPPAADLLSYFLMMFIDYIIAFGVLGLSGLFAKRKNGLLISVPFCITLRYLCHVVSGVILWGSYAWVGWAVWPYSFAYNATYLLPEIIITFVAAYALIKALPMRMSRQ